ncbi:gliding motility-associated C-terminal domain-containing protein [Thermaurantimonas aggregans]|nr:gliding motility-associated C-terminal domain-containing protein [Thermaurantimonas aggregans]MCX8148781.1 gliding motility-associated C-terminal domain-containing protein [Thermaurantimonas aggregans]
MRMYKNALFTIFLFVFSFLSYHTKSSHIRGGEITWRCAPNGGWIFTFKIYGECGSTVISQFETSLTQQLQIQNYPTVGGTTNVTVTRISRQDISPKCWNPSWEWRCTPNNQPPFNGQNPQCPPQFTPCDWNGQSYGAVAEFVYESAPIMLSGTPPAQGWTVNWNVCCRNNSINIVGASGQSAWFRSVMFPKPNPTGPGFMNASTCYDNSPQFLEPPVVVICAGNPQIYSPLSFDKDLDPVQYSLANGLGNNGNPMTWATGYSANQPFPTNAPNGPTSIDPTTGNITINQIGNITEGNYLLVIRVTSFCGGVPISEVYRDVQISIVNCQKIQGNPPNNAPSLTISPIGNLNYTLVGNTLTVYAVAKDTIQFNLLAQDIDLNPLPPTNIPAIPQQVRFFAAGGQVGANLTDTNSCDFPPCAVMHPGPGQSGYTNPVNNAIKFFWRTDCNHLSSNSVCGISGLNEYVFTLRMSDNYCPSPAIAIATVRVIINASSADSARLHCVNRLNNNGVYQLNWTPPQDTGYNFNYYIIYGSPSPAGPYVPLDTLYGWATNTYTTQPLTPNTGWNFYVASNMGCNYSSNSDTLRAIELNLNVFPPNNGQFGQMTWNDIKTNGSSDKFFSIWAEHPKGSNNWIKLDSTKLFTYTDTVNACGDTVAFQIRAEQDSGASCFAYSNIEDGYFTDISNTDTMQLVYVTVNNNKAQIDFLPSNSGDVETYYILSGNPFTNTWSIVDTLDQNDTLPHIWQGSNAGNQIEYFRVISADSCGNFSDDQIVVWHNTLLINYILRVCEGTNTLYWNRYNGWGNDLVGYEVYADINSPILGNLPNQLLFTGTPNDTFYVQTSFEEGADYCYRVEAIHTNGIRSVSQITCMNPGVLIPSNLMYIPYTEVKNNAIQIEFFYDGAADIREYILQRGHSANGPFYEIVRFPHNTTPPFRHTFTDNKVDINQSYFYRVVGVNNCDTIGAVSNHARNIVVKANALRSDVNRVHWNPYTEFNGGVFQYQILRKVGEFGAWQLLPVVITGTDTMYLDDIKSFEGTENLYCYKVIAVEGTNTLPIPPGFGPFVSTSNETCVNQKVKLFVPNAIRPGSPILENRTFRVQFKYLDITRFSMQIFNRWGQLMFETDDPNKGWDATFEGKEVPAGVYTYLIKYATPGDNEQEERGTFTVIR